MAPRLIHKRPGPVVARMPGTGTPRRSSTPARIKAIVGKSVGVTRVPEPPGLAFSPLDGGVYLCPEPAPAGEKLDRASRGGLLNPNRRILFAPSACAERRTVNGERFPSYIAMPPSTVRTWPVMYLASGLAINATAAAISSHSPNLANGIKERTWVFTASGN